MSEATTNDVTNPTPEISPPESAPESAPASTPATAPADAPASSPAPTTTPLAPGRLKLPHTANCLVCGRDNPHGLKLDFSVVANTGVVIAEFVGQKHHAGFEGLIHGGLISTVMDEAMTWAATWNIKRFCLCGEPSAKVFDEYNKLLVTAAGKYVPVSGDQHGQFIRTFIDNPDTRAAAELLGLRRHEEIHE
jgi:hypothetical protein